MRGGEENYRDEAGRSLSDHHYLVFRIQNSEIVTGICIFIQILLETGFLSDGSGKVKFFFEINKSDGKQGLNNARNHLERGGEGCRIVV